MLNPNMVKQILLLKEKNKTKTKQKQNKPNDKMLETHLFHANVANADTRSLKSLHTFLFLCLKMVAPHAKKLEQICMVQIIRKFRAFWQKEQCFYNHFWQNVNPRPTKPFL